MLTVNTTAPSAVAPAGRQPAAPGPLNLVAAASLLAILGISILALRTSSKRLRSGASFALMILGMAGIMLMASCGGSSNGGGGGGGGGTSGGTPTGSTTAAIVGTSGSATTSLNFTLDVQ
jgi:hypothetical protein